MDASRLLLLSILLVLTAYASAQTVPVGKGLYTTTFPGNDDAGGKEFPSGPPQLSGHATFKFVPTND